MSDCSCWRCTKEACERDPQSGPLGDMRMMRMFGCASCGNKRCPTGRIIAWPAQVAMTRTGGEPLRMTKTEAFRSDLRGQVRLAGGAAAFAKLHGLSYEYLRLQLNGEREPGPAILAATGWERRYTYHKSSATPKQQEMA